MTLDQFVEKYNNKGIDYDGAYGNQCQDLYRQYVKEVLNFPQSPAVKGAKDVWDTYLTSYFTRYNNTPTAVPKKGDVVIWGTKLGEFGHIAIFLDGGLKKFNSFDQNFPIQGYKDKNGNFIGTGVCHIQSHTYTGVLGWIRPKEQQVAESNPLPDWFKTLLQERGLSIQNESEIRSVFDKATKYDNEIRELNEKIKSANETLSDKSLEVSNLTEKLQSATSKVDELEILYGKTKSEKDTMSWELDKSKIKISELEKGIVSREDEIRGLREDYRRLQEQGIEGMTLVQLLITYFRRKK